MCPLSAVAGTVACEQLPPAPASEPDPTTLAPRGLDDVIASPPEYGSNVVIGPLRVVSGRQPITGYVYAQDPNTGRGIELRPGRLDPWPPEVGVDLTVRVAWTGTPRVPTGWVASLDDVLDQAAGGVPMILDAPGELAPPAVFALARWPAVEVKSNADPLGRADTSLPWPLHDRFLINLPNLGSRGGLTALVQPDGALAPRFTSDWEGTRELRSPIPASVAAVRAGVHLDGSWVSVTATQATPWSADLRYAVLQDEHGFGVWVDAEGMGLGVGEPGEVRTWAGEVRHDGDVAWLRAWETPSEPIEAARPVRLGALGEASIVEVTVTGLAAPDAWGDRATAEGWLLDDRFGSVASLPDPSTVRAAARVRGGETRLAVLPAAVASP